MPKRADGPSCAGARVWFARPSPTPTLISVVLGIGLIPVGLGAGPAVRYGHPTTACTGPPSVAHLRATFPGPAADAAVTWGAYGHYIATTAAVNGLPRGMPRFFRKARRQLVYLSPEPDRWRSRELKEMDDAWEFDHYIDWENVPPGALDASDRWEFVEALFRAGIERPQQFVGFLPFRIIEVYQRLTTEFALWRNAENRRQRGHIQLRILNDAGILGHYVADAAQPHHTTIHFNGWAEGAPNPRGFSTDRDFHARFESAFVEAHIEFDDVEERMAPSPRELRDVRGAILEHVRASNATVERLYELEQAFAFDPSNAHPETTEFVVDRLAAGAEMLRALWWSAWVKSEELASRVMEERRGEG